MGGCLLGSQGENNRAKTARLRTSLGVRMDRVSQRSGWDFVPQPEVSCGSCGLKDTGQNKQGETGVGRSVFKKWEEHFTHLGPVSCSRILRVLSWTHKKTNNTV